MTVNLVINIYSDNLVKSLPYQTIVSALLVSREFNTIISAALNRVGSTVLQSIDLWRKSQQLPPLSIILKPLKTSQKIKRVIQNLVKFFAYFNINSDLTPKLVYNSHRTTLTINPTLQRLERGDFRLSDLLIFEKLHYFHQLLEFFPDSVQEEGASTEQNIENLKRLILTHPQEKLLNVLESAVAKGSEGLTIFLLTSLRSEIALQKTFCNAAKFGEFQLMRTLVHSDYFETLPASAAIEVLFVSLSTCTSNGNIIGADQIIDLIPTQYLIEIFRTIVMHNDVGSLELLLKSKRKQEITDHWLLLALSFLEQQGDESCKAVILANCTFCARKRKAFQ